MCLRLYLIEVAVSWRIIVLSLTGCSVSQMHCDRDVTYRKGAILRVLHAIESQRVCIGVVHELQSEQGHARASSLSNVHNIMTNDAGILVSPASAIGILLSCTYGVSCARVRYLCCPTPICCDDR